MPELGSVNLLCFAMYDAVWWLDGKLLYFIVGKLLDFIAGELLYFIVGKLLYFIAWPRH